MSKSYSKQIDLDRETEDRVLLQLLLFIDERPSSQENIQQIQKYLKSLKADYSFQLQVIELGEQPHLVEYLRLVATPALVKIAPAPRQILAGSDLIAQLAKWWPRWQIELAQRESERMEVEDPGIADSSAHCEADRFASASVNYSAELIELSDEIFRLKKEKEELLEQLEFKDRVVAMLAHDLRSPLTAASIAVETLELAQTQLSQERNAQLKEQLYKQAKSQFQIMNRMISDILQASKSMSAKLEIYPRKLYLQSLCEEILGQFQTQFVSKSQILEKDIPQDLPPVYGDEELLRQVIVNLLDNATKYTPEGGRIAFSILHRTTQKIQITVGDSGPGIPEEKREKIFEGHFRLKRDEAKDGYGLGLALCRQIVGAHYGQIWAESIPNQGSCFHFTLPAYVS